MKKILYFLILSAIAGTATFCGTKKTAVQLAEEQRVLTEKIQAGLFTFTADYVIPIGNFQPRYLTSSYDVKITNDTVYSHLPYFGVAYEAPWNPSESPLVFNSMDFDYSVAKGNRPGNWIVNLRMNDRRRPIMYVFSIWENGKADLTVWDSTRQTISFRGEVEKYK